MGAPLVSLSSNNPIVMCLGFQVANKKLTTTTKTSWAPFRHPQIKLVGSCQAFCQGKLHEFSQCLVHQCKKNLFSENLFGQKAHLWVQL
jgi:hypothetical protein